MRPDPILVLGCFVLGLFAAGQFAKISLILPELFDLYPNAPVPYVFSGVAVMGIVLGVIAGSLVARIGPRQAIIFAVALGAACSLAQAALPSFWLLITWRLLEGLSHLALVIALPTLMAQASSDAWRPIAMGLWGTFFGVGFALYGVVGPLLGSPAAILAAHGIGMAAVGLALIPRLPRLERTREMRSIVEAHRSIYTTPRLMVPGVGHGLYTIYFVALVTFLPEVLGRPFLFVVLPVAGLIGTFLAGFLARGLGPARVVMAGYVLSGSLFTAMALIPSLAPALCIVAMLCSGLIPGGSFAAVPALNEGLADRARANGGMAQLGNVGTFAGVPIMAALLPWGLGGLMGFTVLCCILGLTATTLLYARASRT